MLGEARLTAHLATVAPERARQFYEDVLNLRFLEENPFFVSFDARGTPLSLQKVESFTPHPFTALGWQVDDIRATMDGLTQKGVRFEHFDGLEQDETGLWIPPGGKGVCWFKDPDGNLLSLSQDT